MNNIDVAKAIVAALKKNRSRWQLSGRRINYDALTHFEFIDGDEMLDAIESSLRPEDYVKGPVPDNHPHPLPGPVWIFKTYIEGELCYLKVQRKPNKTDFWISAHLDN